MRIVEGKQYSDEWREARRGLPSASNFHKILTAKKCELSAQADDYICELIAEKYGCGEIDGLEDHQTAAMRNGSECEPEARRWYEVDRGLDVREVCLCVSDCGRWCCSPDGLVDPSGGVEIKAPTGNTQVRTLLDGVLPNHHKAQVHGCLVVTGREWWDYLSYVPGLPPFLIRIIPDDFTQKMREALEAFDARYQEIIKQLNLPAPGQHESVELPAEFAQ